MKTFKLKIEKEFVVPTLGEIQSYLKKRGFFADGSDGPGRWTYCSKPQPEPHWQLWYRSRSVTTVSDWKMIFCSFQKKIFTIGRNDARK